MTEYHKAWLDSIASRDMFYIQMLIIVIVGYSLYRQFLRRFFKPVLAVATLVIVAGLAWGVFYLGGAYGNG